MKHQTKVALFLVALVPVVLQGQACGDAHINGALSYSSESGNSSGTSWPAGAPLPESELKPLETARVVHKRELLSSTMSILDKPYSDTVYTTFSAVADNLSDDGFSDSVSAPMMNSILGVNGTACSAAVASEKNLPDAQRTIFKGFVFNMAPTKQMSTVLPTLVRTLARRAWLRNETPAELALILDGAKLFNTAVVDDTPKQALFICSAMLSSLDAVSR